MLNEVIPNNPEWIYNNAIKYKQNKDKVLGIRNSILGQPKLSFMDSIDNTATDLGSGIGLGMTIAGAKLNQYKPLQKIGMPLKQQGINTLLDKNLTRRYGYGVPILGAIGTGGLVANKLSTFPEYEDDD